MVHQKLTKSHNSWFLWPVGQAVKTAASHAVNVGSIPARVTKIFLLSSVGRARDTVTYRKELLQDKQKTGLIFVQTS